MYKNMKHAKGFTLTELLVVFIILIVLVAVTAPLSKTIINRMIAKEAIGTLRAMLAAEKRYMTKYRVYTDDLAKLGFLDSDLNGVYFSRASYSIDVMVVGEPTFFLLRIRCKPEKSDSPKADAVNGWGEGKYIGIDKFGDIYSNLDWLGYNPFPE